MVKDRLAELRQAQPADNDAGEDAAVITIEYRDTDFVEDEFFTMVSEVQDVMGKLRSCVQEVKKKHSQILSAPFPDERVRDELENLMASIKKDANCVRSKLKGLGQKIAEAENDNNNSTALLILRTQHEALAKNLVQVMTEYNVVQTSYREACKNRIRRQLEITGRDTTDEEIEEMLEEGDLAIFTQGIIMETQQARQTLADIEARHADILQLEKSIRELHDMFMEMALLVETQGEKIDSIEFNVERAANCVNKGKEEVQEAVVYQQKARRKKVILIVILIVVLIIILSIVLGIFV